MNLSDPRRPTALDDLPVEILELIFLRCLLCEPRPSSIGLDWCPVNKRTAPLLLCQISRYWRAVALGCPSLWAFLAVKCTPRTLRPNFPLIRTWLDRSTDHPFSFNIGARWNISFLEDIIPMFLAEFPRWHDVIIRVPEIPSSPSIHLPAGVTTAPLLVRLHVEVGGGRIPSFTEELLRGLPSLRTLSWKVPGIRGLFLLDNISWAQLTNLHLKCKLSVENCLFVLHRSTLLRHCHLETICTDEVISSQADHLSIKPSIHLQSLQIVANISFIPLLQVLNLPALESLTISATAPQARFVCSTSPSLLTFFAALLRRCDPWRWPTHKFTRTSLSKFLNSLLIWLHWRFMTKLKMLSTPLCQTISSDPSWKEMSALSLVPDSGGSNWLGGLILLQVSSSRWWSSGGVTRLWRIRWRPWRVLMSSFASVLMTTMKSSRW